MSDERKLQSGVRNYAAPGATARLRAWSHRRRLGAVGREVTFEPRISFLRHPELIELGDRVIVKEGARICPTNPDARIRIGDWTTIGYHTHVFAASTITIGANCLIAPFCYLVDSNHGFRKGTLIREQDMTARPISIGEDVWLGTGVTVLAGVSIGSGAVVAAGSVVTGDLPSNCIASGNPATVTGERR